MFSPAALIRHQIPMKTSVSLMKVVFSPRSKRQKSPAAHKVEGASPPPPRSCTSLRVRGLADPRECRRVRSLAETRSFKDCIIYIFDINRLSLFIKPRRSTPPRAAAGSMTSAAQVSGSAVTRGASLVTQVLTRRPRPRADPRRPTSPPASRRRLPASPPRLPRPQPQRSPAIATKGGAAAARRPLTEDATCQ